MAGQRAVGLAESIEDVRKKLWIDPLAGVDDLQRRSKSHVVVIQLDRNISAGWRELDGIG